MQCKIVPMGKVMLKFVCSWYSQVPLFCSLVALSGGNSCSSLLNLCPMATSLTISKVRKNLHRDGWVGQTNKQSDVNSDIRDDAKNARAAMTLQASNVVVLFGVKFIY